MALNAKHSLSCYIYNRVFSERVATVFVNILDYMVVYT